MRPINHQEAVAATLAEHHATLRWPDSYGCLCGESWTFSQVPLLRDAIRAHEMHVADAILTTLGTLKGGL